MSSNKLIEEMNITDEAKETLRRVEKVSSSTNASIKSSVKNLFVVGAQGAEISEYAKLYEKILDDNQLYSIRGKGTYLELAFPRLGNEKDYKAFFNSPRLVAATINDFVGVFLISFEQWSGYKELSRDPMFNELIKYIENNRKTIFYVFHVLPEFTDSDVLFRKLSCHVNLMKVLLEKPGIKEAEAYVSIELKKNQISVTKEAQKKLNGFISDQVNVNSNAYVGYQTLRRFTENFVFETACMCEANEKGVRQIDAQLMNRLISNVDFSTDYSEGKIKIGFM